MSEVETALPEVEQSTEVGEPASTEAADTTTEAKPEEVKPEKTPEERERARMQRAIDRKTRQAAEARAEAAQLRAEFERLRQSQNGDTNRAQQDDSDTLSLSRAELQKLVKEEAARLAPTINDQQAAIEQRQGVVKALAKTWGQEKFDALASDLDDAFGGLADGRGQPKPATDAIFEADNPAELIEYLADPEHTDEAEAIARMSAVQAGRAIAKLEAKLQAKKAEAKPKASNAPAPLEPLRGAGTTTRAPDPSNTAAWVKWANEQERKGLL